MTLPQIALLGTEHLANWNGEDGEPDIFSPERQAQLEELVRRLARWAPTKVAVEMMPETQDQADEACATFDPATTKYRSEIAQIGFRLARRVGTPVLAIDGDWALDGDGVEDHFERFPENALPDGLSESAQETVRSSAALKSELPIAEFLELLNREPHVGLNDREYLDQFLTVGAGDNWGGVDLVASWYRRNFRIFANLLVGIESDDRVLVVYGLGHIPSLTHFASLSNRVDLVPIADLLASD